MPWFDQFQNFGRHLYSEIVEFIGWDPQEGESHLASLLRTTVLKAMCSFEHESTVETAIQKFEEFLEDPSRLSPDLRYKFCTSFFLPLSLC